jgi:UDP-N-acetyl-D-glucosamine dehydrogenase
MTHKEALLEKILSKKAAAGIVGLGYVGLPLAVEFGRAGFSVVGFDVIEAKISHLNQGKSYIQDVPDTVIAPLVEKGLFKATNDFSKLAEMDTINICVPTPLRKTKDPDMSFIVSSTEEIAKYLRPGTLVILESTTYPGTTDELVLPMLEKSGLKVGEDFFVCFSPERVDPGNAKSESRWWNHPGLHRTRRRFLCSVA